jgi:hypothetical protein
MRQIASLILYVALIGLIHCKVVINSTNLSTARSAVSGIQAGNKIFFAGGFELDDLLASSTIDIFNMDDNEWQNTTESLPHPRANIAPVVLGRHIYFLGGNEYTNKPYTLSASDDKNLTRIMEDPPTVREPTEISLHNEILTVVGKRSVDFYDTVNNTWSTYGSLRNILTSLQDPLVIAAEKYVFILGGANATDSSQVSNILYVFNVETRTLIERSTLEVIANSTTKRAVKYHFNNNVLVVQANNSTLLYHVIEDSVVILDLSSINFITSTSNSTFLYTSTKFIFKSDWPATNSELTLFSADGLTHSFGFDEYVGYVSFLDTSGARIFVHSPFSSGFTQISFDQFQAAFNWGGKMTGYNWPPNRHVVSDDNSVLIIDMETLNVSMYEFGEIQKIIVSDGILYIFTEAGLNCALSLEPMGGSYNVSGYPCMGSPDAMVGQTVVYLDSGVLRQWPSRLFAATFPPMKPSQTLLAQDNDVLFMMRILPEMALSGIIDVYDHVNGTWLDPIVMPPSVIGDAYYNIIAATFNDMALAWFNDQQFEISSPEEYNLFNESTNNLVNGNYFQDPVHSQLAVVVGNDVYLKSNSLAQALRIYNDETGWDVTKQFPDFTFVEPMQLFRYNRAIYMIARDEGKRKFENVYFYNIDTKDWQITRYPESVDGVTAALIGDYLALFVSNGHLYSLHMPSGLWIDEPLFDSPQSFSTVVMANNSVTFVSGSRYLTDGRYSSTVLMLTDDGVSPPTPLSVPSTSPSDESALDDNTLVIAVVVPIGAVAIAGALLAFFLIRRYKKQKRKRAGATSVIGLETKYGQWFTPFDQIKFGEQLGKGSNGQVFKGTWKNSTVALKVSMTQANSSVIGELELMMKMRPHPNVVQLFGFSIHPETDSIILIIEYCDQGSLDRSLFNDKRQLSTEQKVKWITSAAQGLSHLHSNNIVHRDVAARNVLLHQNEPKITDFGMSRFVDEDDKKGTTRSELGPIRWMAPEALRSKEYSTKSGKSDPNLQRQHSIIMFIAIRCMVIWYSRV